MYVILGFNRENRRTRDDANDTMKTQDRDRTEIKYIRRMCIEGRLVVWTRLQVGPSLDFVQHKISIKQNQGKHKADHWTLQYFKLQQKIGHIL